MRLLFILFLSIITLYGQVITEPTIEIGTFNAEWFPCKDDGEMMKKYNINFNDPPAGKATDLEKMFTMLQALDLELIGLVEIVDTKLMDEMAKKYLGPDYHFVFAPSPGSQRVGFLYDGAVLEIIGEPEIYRSVALDPDSWLRPAFRVNFKVKPAGFDFQAIVTHLKAGPAGWKQREKQWQVLKNIITGLQQGGQEQDILLMGDFNNVSKLGFDEFRPIMNELNFSWLTGEKDSLISNYWQPDYTKERIQSSLIDQIFISAGAGEEYVTGSVRAGGMCADGAKEYEGGQIPDYYEFISDHCPVYVSFRTEDLD